MNNKTDEIKKGNTYTIPVVIVGLFALVVTFLFAFTGVISTAQVKEADDQTISEAKKQAALLVPVKNENYEETIETAIQDSKAETEPGDLNLRDPYQSSVRGNGIEELSGNTVAPTNGNGRYQGYQMQQQPQNFPGTSGASPGLQRGNTLAIEPNLNAAVPKQKSEDLIPALESRLLLWKQQVARSRTSFVEPSPKPPSLGSVYKVSEVTPVGILTSGTRKLINFVVYQPEENSFSLEPGDRLFDAVISSVSDAGVVYQLNDGTFVLQPLADERKDSSNGARVKPELQELAMPDSNGVGSSNSLTYSEIDRIRQNTSAEYDFENLYAKLETNESILDSENVPEISKSPSYPDNYKQISYKLPELAPQRIAVSDGSPCSENFVGEPISYTSAADFTLYEFFRDLQKLYQISFIIDKEVTDENIVLKVENKPWNYVLQAILRGKNLEARCLTGGIISVEPIGKQNRVEQENQKNDPLILRRYTLRYIPLSSGGSTQIADAVGGGSYGGGGSSGSSGGVGIESQINQLLSRSGDSRASVTRVPNSSFIAVYATAAQHRQISDFIDEIDKPGFQVQIETNFYTVQDTRFKDLGGQVAVIVGDGGLTNFGGITNLPSTGTDGGGVPGFPSGFGSPNSNLRASANTLFGAGFTIGTTQFSAVFSAAQQKGIANSQARSIQTVLNGGVTEIRNGDTVIIPTTGAVGGSLVNSGAITLNATQSANIQPQVVVDKDGNPVAVTLNMQLTNNSINRAFAGTATPVVSTQTQSGTVRIPLNQTYVISGFFTDSVVDTRNNTPGLSKIPLLGELFKRKLNQEDRNRLYFAISVKVFRDIDVLNIPAPSDIDTSPVPAPAPQKPPVRPDDKSVKMPADNK